MSRMLSFALLLALAAAPAAASVEVRFFYHEGHGRFPHAFVLTGGAMDAFPDHPVEYNYGFTARAVTPAILMGPVGGKVEAAPPEYVAEADEAFRVTLTDDQYRALSAEVQKWRDLPAPSYDLNKRNCVSFVGDLAKAVGLTWEAPGALIRKPQAYLLRLKALNPRLEK